MKSMNVILVVLAMCFAACAPQGVPQVDPGTGTDPEPGPVVDSGRVKTAFEVMAKAAPDEPYQTYSGRTVENIEGFTPKTAPELDKYGGLLSKTFTATGYFRVEKEGDRWWMVTPLGHAFIAASVGEFMYGSSDRQKSALAGTFKSLPVWAASEMSWIKSLGFTALGRGNSATVREVPSRIPYCVYASPMTTYTRHLKNDLKMNFPANTPMVFDTDYDEYLTSGLSWLSSYAADPYCLGIFTDNELFWTDDLLKIYLSNLPASNANRIEAQRWLDERKGKSGSVWSSATEEDKDAFKAYCLETYLRRTSAALRQYDPNHLYIGNRFYKWTSELSSKAMMEAAGKYIDVISINFYTKWEPVQEDFDNWSGWSGRPILISEFYVKGEDSGLPNTAGLGWIVPTQEDRGLWYENFVAGLIKTGKCVGWQWFKYQDNDPQDTTADASNTDSNKGLVTWDFKRYDAMIKHMSAANAQIYHLAEYYTNNK